MKCLCPLCGRPQMKGHKDYDLKVYLAKRFEDSIANYGIDIRKSRKKRTTVFGIATADDLDKIMAKTTKLEEVSFER